MADSTRPRDRVDLTNCDREQIHIPGAILPHGAMLVIDPATMMIEQVAGDTLSLLGMDAAALGGQKVSAVFNPQQVERLRDLVQGSSLTRSRHLLDPLMRVLPERAIDASVHLSGGALVVEVEDADLADRHAVDPLACVQEMFDGLGDAPDLQTFCQIAAERVRSVAGYDRVMVYRFMPDESGWVCGTGSFFIRPLPTTDSQFLAHLIRSDSYREKLEQASTGATRGARCASA